MEKLEDILQAYVEQETVPEDVLSNPEATELINRFNREREERPCILEKFTVFKDYALLADFLRIPVVDMEMFVEWEKEHPRYLKGQGKGEYRLSRKVRDNHQRTTLNTVRWVNQLKEYYQFWKTHHQHKGIKWNIEYLLRNEDIKKHYGTKPINTYSNSKNNLKDKQGINHIIGLASQQDNNIAEAWTGSWNEHIATLKLQTYYQHWKTHHKQKGIKFNTTYLIKNQELNQKFSHRPRKFIQSNYKYLKNKGGINYLKELVAVQEPSILRDWNAKKRRSFNIKKAEKELREYHGFWKTHHQHKGIKWDTAYLIRNEDLKNQYGTNPRCLYDNSNNHIQEQGGINHIVTIVAQQQPELAEAWTGSWNEQIASIKVQQYYQYWKTHHQHKGIRFNTNYLRGNEELNQYFQNRGAQLMNNIKRKLKGIGGANHVIKMTAEKQPKILQHWRRGVLQDNGTKTT